MPLPVRHRDTAAARPRAAAMQRWDPLRELEELQQATAELLQSAWGTTATEPTAWMPLVDIEETEDAWIVEAELPGARPEDVNVEVRDNELAVTGEIKDRERTGILRRRTRRVGRFEYRVQLPGATNPDEVDASIENGVLTIRIPKPTQARTQRVGVRSGGTESGSAPGGAGGQAEVTDGGGGAASGAGQAAPSPGAGGQPGPAPGAGGHPAPGPGTGQPASP